jgi:hypothetical protein
MLLSDSFYASLTGELEEVEMVTNFGTKLGLRTIIWTLESWIEGLETRLKIHLNPNLMYLFSNSFANLL